ASKITKGLRDYLHDIAINLNHPQRRKITERLQVLAEEMKNDPDWETKLQFIKKDFLTDDKIKNYAGHIWQYSKKYISEELGKSNGAFRKYLDKTLVNIAQQ